MSVQHSHDIGLDLQHKIEALEEVERCFVHIDYQNRDTPEHRTERELSSRPGQLSRQESLREKSSVL